MGKNTLENLSAQNLSAEGKRRLAREIVSALISLACLLAGWGYSVIFPNKPTVAAMIYVIGIVVESAGIFAAAIKGFLQKNMTHAMEILVAIAVLACFFDGQYVLAILIPVILNLAHFFEERSIMGGREVIDGLRRMQADTAILLDDDGKETLVDAKKLEIGQKIIVKPGASIPIDGTVVRGESNVDQKSLTGESLPQAVGTGDSVYAGTINLDGVLVVAVSCTYVDTSFSKILDMLEKSESISVPESRLIDRFMQYYIPLILTIAAAVALINRDISAAIAILVVSCPCGQMLVSSAPMIAALAASTRRGVLIKNAKFIEELTEIDTVVFDKTGTVTSGSLSISSCTPVEGVDARELLWAAAAVAVGSLHPVARAVMRSVEGREELLPDLSGFSVREITGRGMRGVRGDEEICFGSGAWFAELGFTLPACEAHTGPINWVAKDGRLLGSLCFDDTLRPEAPAVISSLRALGVGQTVILTGDRADAAEQIRAATGVDQAYAQLLPEDKLARVRALRGEGENLHRVLVVGDGINDAPALKEADVGIAMGAMGSDTAIQSADIALMNNNLDNIPFAIRVARRTRAIIYQNIVLSFLISFTMIILSAFGVITPIVGAVLHNVGAFVVLINSARILKEEKKAVE